MSVHADSAPQARPHGRSLDFPDGTVYVITEPADGTGDRFQMDMILVSDGDTPPPHIHPHQHEHYEVMEGSFEVQIAGTWHTLTAGQTAEVKPGERHHFRNTSGAVARVRTTFRPALSFEDYIQRVHLAIATGKLKGPQDPKSLLYLSMLFHEHRDSVRGANAPQRIVMAIASSLGRLLRLQLPPKSAPAKRQRGDATTESEAPAAWPALAATALAALAALALSIAVVLGLRELGRAMLDVPNHLAPLSMSTLIPATVVPVIGNTFGFYISFFLKPSRYSMHLFLGIGAVMTIAGIAISMTKLPAEAATGPIITTVAVSVAPVLVIVFALLHLVRGGRTP